MCSSIEALLVCCHESLVSHLAKFFFMVEQLTNLVVGKMPTYTHPWLRLWFQLFP